MEILGGSDMLLLEHLTSGEHTEIIVLEQQDMVVGGKDPITSFNGVTTWLATPG